MKRLIQSYKLPTYTANLCSHLLGILVNPVASDEIAFKQMWPPVLHLSLALTIQSALFFLQQTLLICCRCLIRA